MSATAIGICSRCESPLEVGDLRCAICGQAAPDAREVTDQQGANHQPVEILRCRGCGAAMAYDPEHQAPHCSFCGEVLELEKILDPMEQTEATLPFLVDTSSARQTLRHWLGTLGWFRPSDLTATARLEKLQPLWWVGWAFDAEAMVSWTADSNAGSRRSSWAPHAGRNEIEFDDILVSASRGLTPAEAEVVSRGLRLESAQPVETADEPRSTPGDAVHTRDEVSPDAPPGVTREQFDVPRSQARRHIVETIENLARKRVQLQFIPGSTFRNVRVAVVIRRLETKRLALPAYVLAYRYRDQLYRVVISGQDARHLSGTAPYSVAKIVSTGVAALLGVVVLLSLFAALSGG